MSARDEFAIGVAGSAGSWESTQATGLADAAPSDTAAARAHLFGFVESGAEESDLPSFAAALDDYAATVRAGVRDESLLQAADEIAATADEMERTLGRPLEVCRIERGVADRLRRMVGRRSEAGERS